MIFATKATAQDPYPGFQDQIPPSEYAALLDFYARTGGPSWEHNAGWTDPAARSWSGVTVSDIERHDSEGRFIGWKVGYVSRLELASRGLSGSIPDSVSTLKKLEVLAISHNPLTGSIPSSLGNLSELRHLNLGNSELSGAIPDSLGHLGQLLTLAISFTEVSGPIPDSLGNLTNLVTLNLRYNQLSDSIPTSLGNLSQLKYLYLAGNHLSGLIPVSLGNLSQLEQLHLDRNQLTGSIPLGFGNLSQLQYCNLSGNQLTGAIPVSFGNLGQLQYCNLYANQLTGGIPDSLGNLTQLRELDLQNNELSGNIPNSFGNLTNLGSLKLGGNELSGSIPNSLGNLSQLRILHLSHNNLSGLIPTNTTSLDQLQIRQNCFVVRECPPCLSDLGATNIAAIDLLEADGTFVDFEPQKQCVCLALSNDKVPEQWTGWFGNVIAVNCGGGNIVDYDIPTALTLGSGDTDNGLFQTFFLNSLSNRVEFDYETRSSYSIRVATTAYNGMSGSFTIYVTDVDETTPPGPATIPILRNVTPMPEGGIGLGLAGLPGTVYRLEISTNLLHWETWRMVTIPSIGSTNVADSSMSLESRKFYRAIPQ